MSTVASPPPQPALSEDQQRISEQIDDDIAKVRAEIDLLTKRNNLLTSALISSSEIQKQLRQHAQHTSDEGLTTLLETQSTRVSTNVHRLALGVTSFPFHDPSPDTSNRPLLGVRLEVCTKDGTFDSSYYMMLRRVNDESNELRVHRHTIPALVPVDQYQERYLPLQDEGYGSEDSMMEGQGQDLKGFVAAVRQDLVSWRLRQEAVEMVKERLGLNETEAVAEDQAMKFGVASIDATGVDTHYLRIVWENGWVGRLKIGDGGSIQKAVVIGKVKDEDQRIEQVERLLAYDGARLENLYELLEVVHGKRK